MEKRHTARVRTLKAACGEVMDSSLFSVNISAEMAVGSPSLPALYCTNNALGYFYRDDN